MQVSMSAIQQVGSVRVIAAPTSFATNESLKEVKGSLDDCLQQGKVHLILDMSRCSLINSLGLEMLVDYQEECISHGGKLVVAQPMAVVSEILEVTGVSENVAVFDDLRSALSDFAT